MIQHLEYPAVATMSVVLKDAEEAILDLRQETAPKILLVRPSFRMGNSILATPAIFLFRQNFSNARIDFVGSPVAQALCRNLPIDHQYQITRRFPHAGWAYFALLRQIRAVGYDLAIDLSGSQPRLGSWIVGLSGARYRVGIKGKRGHWFNVGLPKPQSRNKYEFSPVLASSMGLAGGSLVPKVVLSPSEAEEGLKKIGGQLEGATPDIGVFLGGRARKNKRWPKENFVELITDLRAQGLRVVTFAGPEEEDLIGYFNWALKGQVPVVSEKSLRLFAAMVSTCKLFVTCDSGPMHLACALGVPTVAIFLKDNFEHWAPPYHLTRNIHGDVSPRQVLRACLLEFWKLEKIAASSRPQTLKSY